MKTSILIISWKNIWRNRTRSLVVIVAVTLGLIVGMLTVAIMTGWVEQRLNDAISNEISHIQIHHPDFINNEEIQFTINDLDKLTAVLDTMNGIINYSIRSKNFAMIRSDWATTGLVVKGIDLEGEKKISQLKNYIIEGTYFEKEERLPSIVIGRKAAEELKLLNYQIDSIKMKKLDSIEIPGQISLKLESLGSRRYRTEKQFRHALSTLLTEPEIKKYSQILVDHFSFYRLGAKVTITISDTAKNMIPVTFRVQGIYKTSNSLFDGMNAFVLQETLLKETGFDHRFVHEIAIVCKNDNQAIEIANKLKTLFPNQSILSWKEISPDMAYMRDMMKIWDLLYVGIIMFALAFGIINTMLMAVLERTKELGMLMAIGMNRFKVFRMIMYESVFLTLTGALLGMLLSVVIIALLAKSGINLSMWSEGLEAIGYSAIIYPVITVKNYIDITLLVILTGVLAALWPIRKALQLNPAEALRTD